MHNQIINDDWSEYSSKKEPNTANIFICENTWEIDFLSKLIKKHHPEFKEEDIMNAIRVCCRPSEISKSREEFVECVMSNLRWSDL
jgi:hypothetical protein